MHSIKCDKKPEVDKISKWECSMKKEECLYFIDKRSPFFSLEEHNFMTNYQSSKILPKNCVRSIDQSAWR